MSNVKQILIEGQLPFNAHEIEPELLKLYGQLNCPSLNLRIQWLSGVISVPNDVVDNKPNLNNGRTTIYSFRIAGVEAVGANWILWAIRILEAAKGKLHVVYVRDEENDEVSFNRRSEDRYTA